MLLGIDNAAAYLVARGLIEARSIVEGDLKIVDMSRRNRNLQILRHNDASLLLKQPSSAGANNSIMAIKKEALLYLLMQTDADFMALKEIAPRIFDFDDRENVMVTEFIDKARSWNEHNYHSSTSAEPVSKEESAELGRMMAAYHKAFSGFADSPNLHFLQGGFVPAASVVRPGPEIFRDKRGEPQAAEGDTAISHLL